MKIGRGKPDSLDMPVMEALADLKRWAYMATSDGVTGAALMANWRDQWQSRAAGLRLCEWQPCVNAELSTLAKRTNRTPLVMTDSDTAVLLASQTGDGLLSALLTATYLVGGDLKRIRHSATPLASAGHGNTRATYGLGQDPGPRQGRVCVISINNLRPSPGDQWRKAAGGIGDVMRAIREFGREEEIEVHLTGGFKATLLHTLALAEYLKSTVANPASVTAWSLPDTEEESDNNWDDTKPEQIGLRTFHITTVDMLRFELSAIKRNEKPKTSEYAGVAWDTVASGRPALNGFGYGYAALISLSDNMNDEGEVV